MTFYLTTSNHCSPQNGAVSDNFTPCFLSGCAVARSRNQRPSNQAEAKALNGAALSESHANEIRKGGNVELQPWAAKYAMPSPCLCRGQSQLGVGRIPRYGGDKDATQLSRKGSESFAYLNSSFCSVFTVAALICKLE